VHVLVDKMKEASVVYVSESGSSSGSGSGRDGGSSSNSSSCLLELSTACLSG